MRTLHRAIAGAMLALIAASPAYATDEDTQLWVVLNATVPLTEQLTGNFEISPRAREGADQLLTRASVDVKLAEGLTVGGGLAFVEFAGGNELRPHQQIAYTTGPLSLRTRLEERFFQGSERAQLRLRQQARQTARDRARGQARAPRRRALRRTRVGPVRARPAARKQARRQRQARAYRPARRIRAGAA